jgi:hypothetical protein
VVALCLPFLWNFGCLLLMGSLHGLIPEPTWQLLSVVWFWTFLPSVAFGITAEPIALLLTIVSTARGSSRGDSDLRLLMCWSVVALHTAALLTQLWLMHRSAPVPAG